MRSELFVSRIGGQIWTALCEDGIAVELRVERVGRPARAGRVVKARVSRIVPAIQSAFLDVGDGRDGFLHVTDLLLPGEGPDSGAIEQRLKVGRELVVQIVRESPESKGDRVSCHVSLPGRLLVFCPRARQCGVSRRVMDPGERERLGACLARLSGAAGAFVARTAACGVAETVLEAEAARLVASWRAIEREAGAARPPAVLHEEPALVMTLLRDAPAAGFARVVMDDPQAREQAVRFLAPALAARIELHAGTPSLFEAHGLRREIDRALMPRVRLRSGGHLEIQPTEALVSIDVNTGQSVRGRQPRRTILETNLEAAREIARQLRLRDLGGIVVVDFVDMESPEDRRRVVEDFREALARDPARTKVLGLSELGLVELTRKRVRSPLQSAVSRPCPLCSGRGRIPRAEIVAGAAIAELERRAAESAAPLTVRAHPDVARALREDHPVDDVRVVEDPTFDPRRFELHAPPTAG